MVLTQAIQLDTSTGLLAMIGVNFKTVKNSLYLIDTQDGEGTQHAVRSTRSLTVC